MHISQLYTSKVTHVSDIVSLNDIVWVKVIDVQVETIVDDATTTAGKTRSRHRVKLSMKYVNQDSGKDLDPENELFEEDQQRVLNSSGNGSSCYHRGGGHQESGANSLLGRSLVSNIGMSTAIDPGSLILRGTKGVNGSTADVMGSGNFNGYALVGDDEGEPSPPPPLPIVHDAEMEPSLSSSSLMARNVIPMGRGRGMTLPAWMTKSDTTADKLGLAGGGGELLPNESTNPKNDDYDIKSRRRRRDKRHHTSTTKERHNKHESSNAGSSREKHERRAKDRQRRRRRRRDSSSSYSSKETQRSSSPKKYRSRPRSERHSHRSRSHSRTRKKSHHRHHDKHYPSDRSSSSTRQDRAEYNSPSRTSQIIAFSARARTRSQHHQSMTSSDFANVEEARAIVERLELRR